MTPKNESPAKTNEEMLRAIIEAQKANGYAYFWCEDDGSGMSHDGRYWCGFSALEILLDTEGCKAAYPNPNQDWSGQGSNHMHKVSHAILSAWHSGPGNNVNAAIKTAYDLLPPLT